MQTPVANVAYMAASALLQLKGMTGRDDLIGVIQLHIEDLTETRREQEARIEALEGELSKVYEIVTRTSARERVRSFARRFVDWLQRPKGGF